MPDGAEVAGLGVYTVPEAARLTRVPAQRIRRWVFGRGGHAAVLPEHTAQEGQEALSFSNLIEVLFLQDLKEHGVSWPTLRKAAEMAQRVLQHAHPFATSRFHTDGKTILLQTANETGDRHLIDLLSGNGAMYEVLERSFTHSVSFNGPEGIASEWRPDARAERVVVDPRRQFGRPIDRETGVPTDILADALKAENGDAARVASWWNIPIEAVEQAAEFEVRLGLRRAA